MIRRSLSIALTLLLLSLPGLAQRWTPIGPDGGDVRSLTRDPFIAGHILLGTSAGELYESRDGGASWLRFAHLGSGNDYVLDHVVFDPQQRGRIYVAAWSIENDGGDLFISDDNGLHWKTSTELHGKSLRAFAIAPSNDKILIAGALDGVYRSDDAGLQWKRISPADNAEIRNIESIAIDPVNPDAVYAGTWHLPWKTADGGATWKNIKSGVIDDSDIFSIIIDPHSPQTVYMSACSGIYKSDSAGDLFHKAQGIPFSSRRTRVLRQDPANPNIVYAGTTEGLWQTQDGGATWRHLGAFNIIINDILIDPANNTHLLLATDRSGVLASTDAGQSFVATNRGFSHRQVAAILDSVKHPGTIYVGVINDKEFGGVFTSSNGDTQWKQISRGLDGRDVFSLAEDSSGDLLAGTNRGIFLLRDGGTLWEPSNDILNVIEKTKRVPIHTKKGKVVYKESVLRKIVKGTLSARVNDVFLADGKWYAATSNGIYVSLDRGHSWHGGPVEGETEFIAVRANKDLIVAAGRRSAFVSADEGKIWHKSPLPERITAIIDLTVDDSGNIFTAAREGAFRSSDQGASWEYLRRLPANNLASIYYSGSEKTLYATSFNSTKVFESIDAGNSWKESDSGWLVRSVRPVGSHILATTAFDGVVAQPSRTAAASQFFNSTQQ